MESVMTSDKNDDEDRLPDDEERRAAEQLARALDGERDHDADAVALAAARSIRSAAGREAPLGQLRARGLAKAALAEAARQVARAARPAARSRWSSLLGLAAVAAVVVL